MKKSKSIINKLFVPFSVVLLLQFALLLGILLYTELGALASQTLIWILLGYLAFAVTTWLIFFFYIARVLLRPVDRLIETVKSSSSFDRFYFPSTSIREFDELSKAIEQLSDNIRSSSSKMSEILRQSKLPMAIFEYNDKTGMIFCTNNLAEVLDMDFASGNTQHCYTKEGLIQKLEDMRRYLIQHQPNFSVYYRKSGQREKWLRIKQIKQNDVTIGIVHDITADVVEQEQYKYQKRYDLLTGVYNRHYFFRMFDKLFQSPRRLKNAAYMVLDIDNIRYINDTYGHDFGDQFIRMAAEVLKYAVQPGAGMVSRLAGDEFHVLLYRANSTQELMDRIREIQTKIWATSVSAPDGVALRLRMSCGYAFFPSDTTSPDELVKYADFAMKDVKGFAKGKFHHFDQLDYQKNAFLQENWTEFNNLLENNQIYYVFHPIVDARSGEIHGYEALMRSNNEFIKSAFEILSIARAQNRLYDIEQVTLFQAVRTFIQRRPEDNCKLFINSLPNQRLSDSDIQQFRNDFEDYLSRLVIELTEEERPIEELTEHKREQAHAWGAGLALDDYGTGYNGQQILLTMRPSYVKIDMSIVTGVQDDPDRQHMIQNVLSYCKERQIKVIAEGVETREEMLYLIDQGVDFLQGFYLSKPDQKLQQVPSTVRQEILKQAKKEQV